MKHLIETTDLSSLTKVNYDRIILDTTTNSLTIRGGGNANGHPYVDLGLPSGLKWATMNVGASSETDYGDYFMWGSTTPNNNTPCQWEYTPFNNGSSDYNSTYFNSVKNTVCPNNVLAKEYDVASQIMGGDWRMPTGAELRELLDNTTNEWMSNYNGSGVKGIKFTSKTNGNSIFIPAAGIRSRSSFLGRGGGGNVWSSSLSILTPNSAEYLNFGSNSLNASNSEFRYYGMVVRGVL